MKNKLRVKRYSVDVEYYGDEDEESRYTNCDKCKYRNDDIHVCQARLCVHAIDTLYDCFEEEKE